MASVQNEKKRVPKAVKRKAKKVLEAPVADDDEKESEEQSEEQPAAEEVPEKTKGTKVTKKRTKANRLEEMEAKADKEPVEPRGVIYVGHIPDGFMEPQMKKFFCQFGKVTRLRISRSKKSAKSKGYAFVEFEEEGVAKIVAETMQGYLLFDKTLVCHLLPKEKQHPMLFKGCRRRMINTTSIRRKQHTKAHNDRPTVDVGGEQVKRHTLRQVDKRKRSDKKLAAVLANLGVEYDITAANEGPKGAKSPKLKASSPKLSPKVSPKVAAVAAPAAAQSKKKKRKVA